jgi:hypothetical protein
MADKFLNAAQRLASRGLRVFPIKPQLKFPPLIKEWEKKATAHPEIVTQWWTQWPDANIGVVCGRKSGVIVLDVDMKHGQNGEAALRALEAKHGPIPATVESITPHGGRQLWFKAPQFDVKNSVGKLAPGLDIRGGDNGYVVAPPSYVNDKDGAGIYSWSVDSSKEFADAPEWLFPKADVAQLDARRPVTHWQRVCRGIPEGARNETGASIAGMLLRKGIDPETTLQLMLGWNLRCNPPQDEQDIVLTVESILKKEIERRGGTA